MNIRHTDFILETNNVGKSYGAVSALSNVTLGFADHQIYGLFGRNGAGKTTLLDIITARIFTDTGSVTCRGKVIDKHPNAVADICCYLPEREFVPGRFRVGKLLSRAKRFFPHYDADTARRLCQRFKLDPGQKYGQLSRGYQSIFRIVLAMAARAPITVFDEPVLGLDAAARDLFYLELIEAFSDHPRLFILSTHLIEESVDLFNDIIIIKRGRVVCQGAPDQLLSRAFYVNGKALLVDEFIKNHQVISCEAFHGLKTAVVLGDVNTAQSVVGLDVSPIGMQKLFIHLTND